MVHIYKKFLLAIIFITIASAALFVPLVAASSWSAPYKITDDLIEDNDPSLAVHDGKAHVVFVRGSGQNSEIYYWTNKNGNDTQPVNISKNTTADLAPDIAIDETGKVHVAHITYFKTYQGWERDVVYRSNISGIWKTTRLTNTNVYEQEPSIATYKSKAHIVFGREKSNAEEVWYTTNFTGRWKSYLVTNNGYTHAGSSIAVSNSNLHVAYTDKMASSDENNDDEIMYLKANKQDGINVSQITFNTTVDAAPDIAIDPDGKAHIAFRRGDDLANGGDYEIWYSTNKTGDWLETRLSDNSTEDNSPSIAESLGNIFIAWEQWDAQNGNSEIMYLQKSTLSASWDAAEALTDNSVDDSIPSVAADAGLAHIVYMTEDPDGEIIYLKHN